MTNFKTNNKQRDISFSSSLTTITDEYIYLHYSTVASVEISRDEWKFESLF